MRDFSKGNLKSFLLVNSERRTYTTFVTAFFSKVYFKSQIIGIIHLKLNITA